MSEPTGPRPSPAPAGSAVRRSGCDGPAGTAPDDDDDDDDDEAALGVG